METVIWTCLAVVGAFVAAYGVGRIVQAVRKRGI